jgi:hypothetical protein
MLSLLVNLFLVEDLFPGRHFTLAAISGDNNGLAPSLPITDNALLVTSIIQNLALLLGKCGRSSARGSLSPQTSLVYDPPLLEPS